MTNNIVINHHISIRLATVNAKIEWRIYLDGKLVSTHPTKPEAFKKAKTLALIHGN